MLFFHMPSNFNLALDKIRAKSTNTVEQGNAFEKLSKIVFNQAGEIFLIDAFMIVVFFVYLLKNVSLL